MIVVGYDPVAGTVFTHAEGEPQGADTPTDGVTAKHYLEVGTLYIELRGRVADLYFVDLEGRYAPVSLVPAGLGWRVKTGR